MSIPARSCSQCGRPMEDDTCEACGFYHDRTTVYPETSYAAIRRIVREEIEAALRPKEAGE